MKVEGPHLDPNGWLEVRLLEVGGVSKALSVHGRPMVGKSRRGQEGRKICLDGAGKSSRRRVYLRNLSSS